MENSNLNSGKHEQYNNTPEKITQIILQTIILICMVCCVAISLIYYW